MVVYEDECVDCATGIRCLGSNCPNRNVRHLYCDKCEEDVEKLYKYEGQEICEDCLLSECEIAV